MKRILTSYYNEIITYAVGKQIIKGTKIVRKLESPIKRRNISQKKMIHRDRGTPFTSVTYNLTRSKKCHTNCIKFT